MSGIVQRINDFFKAELTYDRLFSVMSLLLVLVLVLALFTVIRKLVGRVLSTKASPQVCYLVDKGIHYLSLVVVVMSVFNRLGINFSALLGAAGIAGIAVGFAAQTSVSNVISGLFVMTERAFQLGDILQIDSVTGVVESFDLLSVRLRTFDNQLVRIPNETIIKTNLVNITHYPVRRFAMKVSVAYGTDLRKVRELLLAIAEANEWAVADPAPVVIFDAFADSRINILFGAWAQTGQYLDLKNSLMIEVYEAFAREGISIPFPQMDIHLDSISQQLPG